MDVADAVYIGDQETDRESADSAGMRFIAIGDAIADNQKDIMGRFEGVQKDMAGNLSKQVEHHGNVAEAIDKQIAAISERTEKYESKLDDQFFDSLDRMRRESVGAMGDQVKLLTEGINNLNSVLKELDGKQVVIKKKGWFSRG